MDALMVFDPTSSMLKNVTPHCFKIQEVLLFFKNWFAKFEALRICVKEFKGEDGVEEDEILRNSGFDIEGGKVRILGGLFGLAEFKNMKTTLYIVS